MRVDAGFIYGFLKGYPLERTLQLAASCNARSTRAAGGTVAQATLEEALSQMQESVRD